MSLKKQFQWTDSQFSLTRREIEVLACLAEGKSYRETAEILAVSISTVRYHIRNAYQKLQVHSEAGAVAKALRMGIIR